MPKQNTSDQEAIADGVLSPIDDPGSSWGKTNREYDADSIRKYNQFLRATLKAGELTAVALSICVLVAFLSVMWIGDFEVILFVDGSESACSFDPHTKEFN